MRYYIYPLRFDTPAHFGAAEQGGKLEQTKTEFASDTLFGALCCELAGDGERLGRLVDDTREGALLLSDLFPYVRQGNEFCLYLPKPLLPPVSQEKRGQALEDAKRESSQRKKQKKLAYIRASRMKEYLSTLSAGEVFSDSLDMGREFLTERVNMRGDEPLPYYVAAFSFGADAGLYLLAGVRDEEAAAELSRLLVQLGLSGIGGKRSSGYGKFRLESEPIALPSGGADAEAVAAMLADEAAAWQMTLSHLLPSPEEAEMLSDGFYNLQKRGGFVTPLSGEYEQKKNSVYMLTAGSCLKNRLAGRVVSLGENGGHDVLRAGKGLYVGLAV